MALSKAIRQDDGVTTTYHRILVLRLVTNVRTSITTVSYVDSDARDEEKSREMLSPYKVSTTYDFPYDPDVNIEKAYGYLKTLPEYEGATDI